MNTNHSMNLKALILTIAVLLAISACGTFQIGVVTPTAAKPETPTDGPPTEITATPTPEVTSESQVDVMDRPNAQTPQNSGQQIAGWLGHVVSLPAGSQYDDFIILSPEGTGEFGLTGASAELEAEIVGLRDKEEPGKFAHFWGTLQCGIPDHNGCQLVVDRLRYGATATEPEPIEGWEGSLTTSTFNSGLSYVFILDSDYPMQFSIHSTDEALLSQLELLVRDPQAKIKVWGDLMTGIPDVNGSRIQATRIEVLERGEALQPPPDETLIEATEGWLEFTNKTYAYQFKYPPSAEIAFYGIQTIPTDELPEGMSVDQYIYQLEQQYSNTICVEIKYSLGVIYISAPPNQGGRYSPCGRTGVGAGELIEKIETIEFGEETIAVNGFEYLGGGETLDLHNETFNFSLEDGTRIEYGAIPNATATYQDYLMKTKEILKTILATYQVLN